MYVLITFSVVKYWVCPLNKSNIFTGCYFQTVKTTKLLLWRHGMYSMQCLRFENKNKFKNQRKYKKLKFQCFWRWIWNLFHEWYNYFFLFSWVQSKSVNTLKIKYSRSNQWRSFMFCSSIAFYHIRLLLFTWLYLNVMHIALSVIMALTVLVKSSNLSPTVHCKDVTKIQEKSKMKEWKG